MGRSLAVKYAFFIFFKTNLIIIYIYKLYIEKIFNPTFNSGFRYTIPIWMYVGRKSILNGYCEVEKQIWNVGIKDFVQNNLVKLSNKSIIHFFRRKRRRVVLQKQNKTSTPQNFTFLQFFKHLLLLLVSLQSHFCFLLFKFCSFLLLYKILDINMYKLCTNFLIFA